VSQERDKQPSALQPSNELRAFPQAAELVAVEEEEDPSDVVAEELLGRLMAVEPDAQTTDRFVAWVATRYSTGAKRISLKQVSRTLGIAESVAERLLNDTNVQTQIRTYIQALEEGDDQFLDGVKFGLEELARKVLRGDELNKSEELIIRQFSPILYPKASGNMRRPRDRRDSPNRRQPPAGGVSIEETTTKSVTFGERTIADQIASGELTEEQIDALRTVSGIGQSEPGEDAPGDGAG